MKDRLNITIRIADQPPIALSNISPQEEEAAREAEYNINRLWNLWSRKFSDKTPNQVLAMVAFRFAQLYFTQQHNVADVDKELENFNSQLDELLAGLPGVNPSSESGATLPDEAE